LLVPSAAAREVRVRRGGRRRPGPGPAVADDHHRHVARRGRRRRRVRDRRGRLAPDRPGAASQPVPDLAGDQVDLPTALAGCQLRGPGRVLPDGGRVRPAQHRADGGAAAADAGAADRPVPAPARCRAGRAAHVLLPEGPAPRRRRSAGGPPPRPEGQLVAGLSIARGLGPLRHRGFRWFTAGQFTSNVGDAFYAVALPWYVLDSHGGALLLGTVLAAYGISRTALLFAGGPASDRWRPWTVMMSTDVVRAVALAALAVTATLGPPRAAILVPLAV